MPALASTDIWRRTILLMLGRLDGVGIAAFLFSFDPGHEAPIAIIVVSQAIAEIVLARTYGSRCSSSRPLAIGMSNLTHGLPSQPMLVEAALGTVVAFLTIFVGRRILKVS